MKKKKIKEGLDENWQAKNIIRKGILVYEAN